MILAAGFGTRLWPLTIDRTKPAIPVLGRPLVGYVAEYLAAHGIEEVLVNLHHRPDSVRQALGDGSRFGVKLSYIEEPEILGTSGALDNARAWLEGGAFVVINGKLVTNIDLREALATHKRLGALATLVLRPNPKRERFSKVLAQGDWLAGFGGMPDASDNTDGAAETLMFTGIQILEPEIFHYIPRGRFSHSTTDVYPQALAAGEKLAVHIDRKGDWRELSTLERYLDISLELLKRGGEVNAIGPGALIEAGAEASGCILWENAKIESGARVSGAILGAGVCVAGDEELQRVAVVRRALLEGREPPPKAPQGYVSGANFVVPLG
jgi:NDP-sugar pyrophosphorylase family protein